MITVEEKAVASAEKILAAEEFAPVEVRQKMESTYQTEERQSATKDGVDASTEAPVFTAVAKRFVRELLNAYSHWLGQSMYLPLLIRTKIRMFSLSCSKMHLKHQDIISCLDYALLLCSKGENTHNKSGISELNPLVLREP
ncbi:hypothetical protein KC19_VG254700 [Ceratodon purpureus]|uniref:Uncharacterized protein n=1 Tax=Ceratodon purpureus TaxID=3225 RepID=A0A8T0HU05_CERPU|nr:hypothetical protein KC19_VG254700 [Ceratodon purpureus]